MATKPVKSKAAKGALVRGRTLAALGSGVVLVRVGNAKKRDVTRPGDEATVLVKKAWQALKKPGIDKHVVFRSSRTGVFSYSVYTNDTSKVVREAADGSRTIGRLVDGKFRVAKAV